MPLAGGLPTESLDFSVSFEALLTALVLSVIMVHEACVTRAEKLASCVRGRLLQRVASTARAASASARANSARDERAIAALQVRRAAPAGSESACSRSHFVPADPRSRRAPSAARAG